MGDSLWMKEKPERQFRKEYLSNEIKWTNQNKEKIKASANSNGNMTYILPVIKHVCIFICVYILCR